MTRIGNGVFFLVFINDPRKDGYEVEESARLVSAVLLRCKECCVDVVLEAPRAA